MERNRQWERAGLAEKASFAALLLVLALVSVASFVDPQLVYGRILNEDGPVENATALLEAAASLILLRRAWRLRTVRRAHHLAPLAILGLGFFFIAGEEVSWGQRIIGFETPGLFRGINAQNELTLHNLELFGIDLSKAIFGKLISLMIFASLTLFPWLYARRERVREWVDLRSLPVPAPRHFRMFLLALALVLSTNPVGKRWELYELALSVIFFFIVLRPANATAATMPAATSSREGPPRRRASGANGPDSLVGWSPPAQTGKPRVVAVGRHPLAACLDGEGRVVGVRNQVALGPCCLAEAHEDLPGVLTRYCGTGCSFSDDPFRKSPDRPTRRRKEMNSKSAVSMLAVLALLLASQAVAAEERPPAAPYVVVVDGLACPF